MDPQSVSALSDIAMWASGNTWIAGSLQPQPQRRGPHKSRTPCHATHWVMRSLGCGLMGPRATLANTGKCDRWRYARGSTEGASTGSPQLPPPPPDPGSSRGVGTMAIITEPDAPISMTGCSVGVGRVRERDGGIRSDIDRSKQTHKQPEAQLAKTCVPPGGLVEEHTGVHVASNHDAPCPIRRHQGPTQGLYKPLMLPQALEVGSNALKGRQISPHRPPPKAHERRGGDRPPAAASPGIRSGWCGLGPEKR